jgi:hypothetical protein
MSLALYHFTCDHGRAALGDAGEVMPLSLFDPEAAQRAPEWASWVRLAWFTDQPQASDPQALGLTSLTVRCDRTRYRYRVLDPEPLLPWLKVWRNYGPKVRLLHLAEGVRPGTWWVSEAPVPVVYAPAR